MGEAEVVAFGVAVALGVAVAFGVAEADGTGEGVGVFTTTDGSGQPKSTLGRAIGGVANAATPGDRVGVAWITIGVNFGHGATPGSGEAVADLTRRATSTAKPPRMIVPTKATAPHSCPKKFLFKLGQTPSRPMLPRQRCQVSQPMLRACCCSLTARLGPAGRR